MSVARAAIAVATIGAALVALASPSLAQDAPPGWQGSSTDPNAWVAFTISPNPVPTVGRGGKWGPIQLTRNTNLAGTDVVAAFNTWEDGPDLNLDNIPDYPIWPSVWSAGGLDLAKAEDCPAVNDSCHYFVTGGSGLDFFVAAGTPPVGPDGAPPTVNLDDFRQSVSLAPEKNLTIMFSWDPNAPGTRVPASGTTPGRLTLDASGSSDQLEGTLLFEWTVTRQSDLKQFKASPSAIAQFDLDADGVYCVALTVTNSQDPANPKTYGVTSQDCKLVDQVAPQAPAPAGTGGGGGGIGGIPTSGNAATAPTVVFAPPRRTRSALTGTGQNVDSSVVWLWRPEWYQPSSETQTLPRTGGAPRLKGRADIVVSSGKAPDSDAGPWLAGLGAFGLIGIGWVLNKRRQVRAEY